MQLRWSEPGSGGNNAGYLNADLTGRSFKYLDSEQREAIYLDIADMEGFKAATRVDSQRTLLQPQATAEDIHRMVRKREIWVRGYDTYSQLGEVDSKGNATKGASITWGSNASATRCCTYNKALEDGWEDIEAVRHEVRSRKQNAKAIFETLLAEIRSPSGSDQRSPEARVVQSVLAKQMTYLDTSRFRRLRDKAEWPENWASDSKPAAFWQEVLEGEALELKAVWRAEKSLEDSMAAMHHQYGRKAGLWVLWSLYSRGLTLQEALLESLDHCLVRLRDEDLDFLRSVVPAEQHEKLLAEWPEWRAVAGHNVEAGTRETYDMGTHV